MVTRINAETTPFDTVIDRRGTFSTKWERYAGRDVLPFWVADMDFAMPAFIQAAIARRLEHPIVGYTRTPAPLVDAFRAWLERHYGWRVPEPWLVWLPGVVPGFNLAARAVAEPGGAIVIPTPVYYPFLDVPANAGQAGIQVPLCRDGDRWVMDFDALEAALRPGARLLLLSNPQNPTGRAYTRAELQALADLALRHRLVVCSDEIHCNLILDPDARHVPIASLGPEIAAASISLYAITKTYNIPGLSCAVAVIPDPTLRNAFVRAQAGLVSHPGPLAYAATQAALEDTGPWVPALLDYLRRNHARVRAVAGARMTPVEATYLAWLDVRDLGLEQPGAFFEQHGLGLSDGAAFGGPGFVRFNFACPRSLLEQGLQRLAHALDAARTGAAGPSGMN
ncbi:MAG: PatB family C-S lyase [Pseudomonadales bacterium]|nr:PatB family C-S lyase [Pseudomonadales bacterium]